jgi:hypothetical protein
MDPGASRPGSLNKRSGSIELPPNSVVYICPRRLLQQRTPSALSSSAVVLISAVSVYVLCPLFSLSPASCTLCIILELSWHRSLYPALLESDRDSGPTIRVTRVWTNHRQDQPSTLRSGHDSLAAPAASMFLPSGFVLHGGMWIADYSSQTSIRTLASATFSVPLPRADITSS